MKKEVKIKNKGRIKRKISIITVFLWIFLVATMVTIIIGNIKNTNAIESENVSVVEKSAFENAQSIQNGQEISGTIKLNGRTIEDKGIINCNYDLFGDRNASKYEILEITNSNPNVASIALPETNTYVNSSELTIVFKPGTIQGTTKILIEVCAYSGTHYVLIPINYTVTNETSYEEGNDLITVTWLNGNKDIIKIATIYKSEEENILTFYPDDPIYYGRKFVGWGEPIKDNEGNIKIMAQWDFEIYETSIIVEKRFIGLDESLYNCDFEMVWKEEHRVTGEILTKKLTFDNTESIDEDKKIVTWKVPHFNEYDLLGTSHEITITEKCYINNYTYIAKPLYAADLQKIDNNTFKTKLDAGSKGKKFILQNIFSAVIINYGSYVVKHEYYTRDKDGSLTLDETALENEVELEAGTNLDTNSIERKPEDYIFYEISDDLVTIEKDIQKIVTIKYVKDKEYGSYVVKHEYYTKDKDGSLTLDNTVLENEVELELGTNLDTNSIERKPEDYLFYEISNDFVVIEKDLPKLIIIKYIKDKEYGSYVVKHEYYTKNKDGSLTLDKTVLEDEVELEANTNLDTNSIERKPEEYTFNEISDDFVVIEKDTRKVITIKYIKDKENVESNVDDVISNNINSVDTSDINVWIYVGITIVSIIVIVVMLILVMKKKKNK